MQRLVIDTNVLVSAFIQKSYPYLIIKGIPNNSNVVWCISDQILEEYIDVLGRAKFFKYADFTLNSRLLFAVIPEITTKYYPEIELDVLEDVSDNKFLELAVTCGANYLITGNTKHFPMKSFGATLIVTPKDYWETHH